MTRKRNKTTHVATITPETLFQARKPRYNAWQGRGGVHGDTKYNRDKDLRAARRDIEEELGR